MNRRFRFKTEQEFKDCGRWDYDDDYPMSWSNREKPLMGTEITDPDSITEFIRCDSTHYEGIYYDYDEIVEILDNEVATTNFQIHPVNEIKM